MGDQSAHYIMLYYLRRRVLRGKKLSDIPIYTHCTATPPPIRGRDGPLIGPYDVQFYSRRRSRLV